MVDVAHAHPRAAPVVRADSDIRALRRVLVHRPGPELAAVAGDPGAHLFDGPMDPDAAGADHDELVAALGAGGADVVELAELARGYAAAAQTSCGRATCSPSSGRPSS